MLIPNAKAQPKPARSQALPGNAERDAPRPRPQSHSRLASFFTILLLILSSLQVPLRVQAAEDDPILTPKKLQNRPFTVGGELDFSSRYVWRGIAYSDGPVFQPSAWISTHGFTFTVWNNIDLTTEADRGAYNELDLYFTYQNEWKKIGFETSLYVYYYPTQLFGPGTAELYVKLSYPLGPIELFTSQSVDIAEYEGAYFGEFGVSYQKQFLPQLSLDTFVSLGWANGRFNQAYLGIDRAALNLFSYNLMLMYYPVEFFYLRPHLEVTTLLESVVRDRVAQPTIVSGGLALGFEF